jgi:S1-C subfamily serine protease
MRATFIHLSGSRRGQSDTLDKDRIRIGTAPECDLRFDPQIDGAVSPAQAEVRLENGGFILSDTFSAGGTFVNDRMVAEIILQDGDFIELGEGGPKLRFRVPPEDVAACKPFHLIVSDAQALARAHPTGGRIVSATDFVKHMGLAVAREASPAVKAGAAGLGLFLLAFVVLVPILLVGTYRAERRTERAVQGIGARLQEESLSRGELARRVEAERQRGAQVAGDVAALREERDRLARQLREADQRLNAFEGQAAAAERIIARTAGGVAFIQGSLGFEDAQGRPLRFVGLGPDGQPLRDPFGLPLTSPEGQGPPATTGFSGTGFVVRRDGSLLTNRHVTEPWEGEEGLAAILRAGFRPKVVSLRAFFPGQPEPFPLQVVKAAAGDDLALLRFDPRGARLPVLELDRAGRAAVAGRAVLLLGYPAGIEALVARADPKTVQEMVAAGPQDLNALADALARRNLIRPITTRGVIGDVQPHQITFDAQTTIGGSGGPLLDLQGRVVGVNFAVLRGFGGSNFAVPIRLALPLLR